MSQFSYYFVLIDYLIIQVLYHLAFMASPIEMMLFTVQYYWEVYPSHPTISFLPVGKIISKSGSSLLQLYSTITSSTSTCVNSSEISVSCSMGISTCVYYVFFFVIPFLCVLSYYLLIVILLLSLCVATG